MQGITSSSKVAVLKSFAHCLAFSWNASGLRYLGVSGCAESASIRAAKVSHTSCNASTSKPRGLNRKILHHLPMAAQTIVWAQKYRELQQ